MAQLSESSKERENRQNNTKGNWTPTPDSASKTQILLNSVVVSQEVVFIGNAITEVRLGRGEEEGGGGPVTPCDPVTMFLPMYARVMVTVVVQKRFLFPLGA